MEGKLRGRAPEEMGGGLRIEGRGGVAPPMRPRSPLPSA